MCLLDAEILIESLWENSLMKVITVMGIDGEKTGGR